MTVWRLENSRFQADINATGAELSRLWDRDTQRERIWQPVQRQWNNSATWLFPVVGRLIHDGVWQDGTFYSLPAHGFLRYQVFDCLESGSDQLLLEARATEETMAVWPWCWRIQIRFTLHDDGVSVNLQVFNDDTRPFWYACGWHPGFALPVATQSGWKVHFGDDTVSGPFATHDRTLAIPLEVPCTSGFSLTADSFQHGAVYFGHSQQQRIYVHSPDDTLALTLETGDQAWLALWGIPGADLLCIEPMTSTTDDPAFDGQIQHKRGMRLLEPGCYQTFKVRVRFAVDV